MRLHASGLPDLCAFSATPEALSGRTCYQNTRYQTSSWLGGGGSERHSEARSPSGRPEPSCPPTCLPALLHLARPPPPGLIAPCLRWSCLVCVHPPCSPPTHPRPTPTTQPATTTSQMFDRCPICLDDLEIRVLCHPCGHAACFECITLWIHHRRSLGAYGEGDCPVCRSPVDELRMNHAVSPPSAPPVPPAVPAQAGVDFLTVTRVGITVRAFCAVHNLNVAAILAANKGRVVQPWPSYTNGASKLHLGTIVWLHANLIGGG